MGFKEARLAAGLTVQQVVKALKVSDASVYLWETGQMYPKTARLHEIADLYGCTVDELLKPRKEENDAGRYPGNVKARDPRKRGGAGARLRSAVDPPNGAGTA